MEYQEYMKSALWKSIRQYVIERDNNTCQKCGRHTRLCVHHLSYPAVLGAEPMETLITLCEDCHNTTHGGSPRPLHKRKEPPRKKKSKPKKYVPKCKVYTRAEVEAYEKSMKGRKITQGEIERYTKAFGLPKLLP